MRKKAVDRLRGEAHNIRILGRFSTTLLGGIARASNPVTHVGRAL
jgi:hypothetical protein